MLARLGRPELSLTEYECLVACDVVDASQLEVEWLRGPRCVIPR